MNTLQALPEKTSVIDAALDKLTEELLAAQEEGATLRRFLIFKKGKERCGLGKARGSQRDRRENHESGSEGIADEAQGTGEWR